MSEIFLSIQGEGSLAGVPSVFVRLAGCDLRCRWCDTKYALKSTAGKTMTADEVLAEVLKYNCGYVVVTGGEPLLCDELPDLLKHFKKKDKHITVEMSATRYVHFVCDLVSISPKLSNSMPRGAEAAAHESHRLNVEAIRRFVRKQDYQLKFVVGSRRDVAETEQVISQLEQVDRGKVYLMPLARTKEAYRRMAPRVAQWCLESGFRFSPRLQVELWGNRRGR